MISVVWSMNLDYLLEKVWDYLRLVSHEPRARTLSTCTPCLGVRARAHRHSHKHKRKSSGAWQWGGALEWHRAGQGGTGGESAAGEEGQHGRGGVCSVHAWRELSCVAQVRVYTKKRGAKPDLEEPVCNKYPCTVETVRGPLP